MAAKEDIERFWKAWTSTLEEYRDGTSEYNEGSTETFSVYDNENDVRDYTEGADDARAGWGCVVGLADAMWERAVVRTLAEGQINLSYFAESAYGFYVTALLGDKTGRVARGKSPEWAWELEAGPALGLNMTVGWLDRAAQIARVYHRSISHPDGEWILGDGEDHYTAPWFVLELMLTHQGLTFDKSKVLYPPDMSPYDEVLARWNTEDLHEVDVLVYKMAEYHCQHSRHNKDDEDMAQFAEMELWLFPYEIYSWLKLREVNGLENPSAYQHPLMQQKVCKLPKGVADVPDIPILNDFLTKLQKEHPMVFEESQPLILG